ncbi:MAG: sulfate ABC transporter substrate-binding protein [Phycisphaerae bacterium]|nr:sulfate ABC transporter substrate-binding protein [Phycisphaerae bacterium]
MKFLSAILLAVLMLIPTARAADVQLLNVSYDPTRELYEDINQAFAPIFQKDTGKTIQIEQSHGGSGKQAHAVLDGLQADVVTLGLGFDITALEKSGLIKPDWQTRLPNNASPYTSTIVFLVRKSNPKNIHNWSDLTRPDLQVVIANPKTSGGARWAFLAAWGQAAGATAGEPDKQQTLDETKGDAFVKALYKNVAVLDSGSRGSTVTFAQKNIGDVLVGWENEAWLAQEEFGNDQFEIVYPSISILAEPPVAVVDSVVDKHGTRAAAEAYLKFLYTPAAQELIAQNHYRPRSAEVLKSHSQDLPSVPTFTVVNVAGDWSKAQAKFFADNGVFDKIYRK